MKTIKTITIAIAGLILLLSMVTPVMAAPDVPPLPSSFYGEVHFQAGDGAPSAGDYLEAYVVGIPGYAARTQLTTEGSNLVYRINVPGDDSATGGIVEGGVPGGTVTFKIGTRTVATATWAAGTNVNLVIHPPQAIAGGPYVSLVNSAVSFSGSAADYGSDAATYEWDWDNDGTYDATGATASHTWTAAGTYTVGFKVTDNRGGVGTTTAAVIVYSLGGLTGQTYNDTPLPITVSGVSAPFSYTVTYNGSATAPTNAGTYPVVVQIWNGTTLVQTISGNNLVIAQRPITVTAVTDTKAYDGTTASSGVPTITAGTLAGDDSATWTQTFDTEHAGTGKTLTPAGTVSDGNGGANYLVTFVTDTTGVINQRAISVTAASDTKTYDGTTASSGVPTITTGSLATGDTASWTQTYNNKHAGTGKTLTPAGTVNDGNGGANYVVTFVNRTDGVISQRTITVTAAGSSKTYDGTTASSGVPTITTGSLATGDTVTWTQTYNNKHAGTGKTLTPAGTVSDGNGGANYAVTFVNRTDGVISQRAITVTAVTDTKAYDGTTASDGVPTITAGSLASGDTATWTQTFNTAAVGTGKTLTPAGTVSDGNGGANYDVDFVNDTTGVITAEAATIAVTGLNPTYNGSPWAVTVITTPDGLSHSVTYNGSTTPPTNAGSYTVVVTITDPNYSGTETVTMVIAKATATVTLSNLSHTYNGSPKSATVNTVPTGLTVGVSYNGSPTAPTNAGSYAVVATINETNYQGTASDTLVIAKAAATVTLSNLVHVYDGTVKAATALTSPEGLTVNIVYNPAAPTDYGDYAVTATVNDINYSGTANATLKILASHSITLVPGWNLVSFNLMPYPSTAPVDVLAGLGSNYDLVYAWDGTGAHSGGGHWMHFDRTQPAGNTLLALTELQGFWIHITSAGSQTLTVAGLKPSTSTISLMTTATGWNLIGFPAVDPSPALPGAYTADLDSLIYAFHPEDAGDPWKLYDYDAPTFVNDLNALSAGWGYWVYVTSAHTWNVTY